jgi:hypothetical protein
MEVITWTLYGFRNSGGKQIFAPSETFPTKRKTMAAMTAKRQPKTPIMRIGHSYTYQMADE